MEMTYEQLVCRLKNKASTNSDAVGIFLEDLSSRKTATIINNNPKEYNKAYIIIGPAELDKVIVKRLTIIVKISRKPKK